MVAVAPGQSVDETGFEHTTQHNNTRVPVRVYNIRYTIYVTRDTCGE